MMLKHKLTSTISLATLTLLTLLCSVTASAEVKLEVNEGELLYSGYYNENAKKNPEDPTAATIILAAPKEDGQFKAELNFNYYGCQKQNSGTVIGNKVSTNYDGTWSGKVDGTSQSGTFKGAKKSDSEVVSGNYTVAKGKQRINDCLSYHIAPNGTFTVEPITLDWDANGKQKVKNKHITLSASKKKITANGSAGYIFLSVYWVDYADDMTYTVRPVKEKVTLGKGITFTKKELMRKVKKWPNQSKVKSGLLATAVSKKRLSGTPKFSYLFIPASAVE